MNGITVDPLSGFEIITDVAGCRWFGKVVTPIDSAADTLTLQPAFEMAQRQYVPVPQGQQVGLLALSMLGFFPLFDMTSRPQVSIRWASRVRVADFDAKDQKMLADTLQKVEQASRAARANLVI